MAGINIGSTAMMGIGAAYLIGSIPFGLLVSRAKGVDIRKKGSGNIGATNVGRVVGKPAGYLVFLLDLLKGMLPVVAAGWYLFHYSRSYSMPRHPSGYSMNTSAYVIWMAVAAACILGHVYPVFLKFRGGKGVATALGTLLGVYPFFTVVGLIVFAVWGIVLSVTRYVSVASIAAAVLFPILFAIVVLFRPGGWPTFDQLWPLQSFAVAIAMLVVYRHQGNIKRLRDGTEPKIGQSRSRSR